MKVLLLSWEYPPVMVGGLGRHVQALATTLVQEGHDVTVVTRHAADAPLEQFLDGVRVIRCAEDPASLQLSTSNLLTWTMAFNHALTRAALFAARTTQYDVIHAHDWLVAHAAITLKEQLGLPLVTTIHATEAGRHQGWLPEESNRNIHALEWWLVNESTRVVVCSHYMRWEVNRLLHAPYRRIDVIPNGVDAAAWRADPDDIARARVRYSGAGRLVGFAGRLVYEKGVQDLIHSLPHLRAQHHGLRLIVAGDGPYLPELREEVRRLNLHRAVSFTGFLGDDLPAVMSAADAMIIPSIYEPFGMVALEAAATGVPVAAATTGGLKEIIEPGRTGMTFPPRNPLALAKAVSHLLSDEAAARKMARTARNMVADRYTWRSIVTRLLRVYRTAITETPARIPAERTSARCPLVTIPHHNLLRDDVA
jgi:glycogen synthase